MKPEVVFGLENAVWPALLLNARGAVLLANTAAISAFGSALNGNPAQLAAIWAAENGGTAVDFLVRWEAKPVAQTILKFRATGGVPTEYATMMCQFTGEGSKWFVMQLLPAVRRIRL